MSRGAFEESQTGWVYRSDSEPAFATPAEWTPPDPVLPEHAWPERQPAPSAPRGWIESGLCLMALPVAITAGLMLAPLVWMFGSRPQR